MALQFDVSSLKNTIQHLLNSSDVSLVPSSGEILEFAYKKLESLEGIAGRVSWGGMQTYKLYTAITEAANKFKAVLESRLSSQIAPQSEESIKGDGIQVFIDLQDLNQQIQSFIELLKKIEEYLKELCYPGPEEKLEDDNVTSRTCPGGEKLKMVGLCDEYVEIKSKIIAGRPATLEVFSLSGMPGIGKTTLSKKIFEDPEIVEHFDCRVWVTVGRKYQLKEIPRHILTRMNPDSDQMLAKLEGDENTTRHLKESLKGKRYFIVLDDVWDKYMAYRLQYPKRDYNIFHDEYNGSRVLLISRLQQVSDLNFQHDFNVPIMRLLTAKESWDLLCEKLFGEEPCPSQLEKVGKKIAENCDGLPLTIITVADLLSREEKAPHYWSEVAENKNHQLFMAAYDEISKVLLPSYKFLPRVLQMCFLYMGVFPQNYEISRYKLINLWNSDEFLEPNAHRFPYPPAMKCLEELVINNLIMTQSTIDTSIIPAMGKTIKTCCFHSSLGHLAKREAEGEKFFCILNSRDDGSGERIKDQRRLSFHNNILLSIKKVYESVENNCASTARSLLFYGPYHQYQVPICFGLRLLKQLDALGIRFYEFPMEILQLVQLKYLALTCNGKLPTSISRLSKLQILIVDQYLNIKSCKDQSYLPVEMWKMKEIKHIQVMGSDLPNPPLGAFLENLSTLSDVSVRSCTVDILKAIPNLRKLGIRIEFAPNDDGKALSCFDHISHLLGRVISLKCVVVNHAVVPPPAAPLSVFQFATKLSLSGLGYPWNKMSKIAKLHHLAVLKLRNYAFRGPKWKVGPGHSFLSLRSLEIEDTDIEEWEIERGSFLHLSSLSMKSCYKFKMIHVEYGEFPLSFEKIELVDCNPMGVEQIKQAIRLKPAIKADVQSSWNDTTDRSVH